MYTSICELSIHHCLVLIMVIANATCLIKGPQNVTPIQHLNLLKATVKGANPWQRNKKRLSALLYTVEVNKFEVVIVLVRNM